MDGNGKRTRKPKTFAGYLTETSEGFFQETEQGQGQGLRAGASTDNQQPQPKRRRSTSSVSATSTPRRLQQQSSSSTPGTTAQPAAGGSVKKVAGVQNATRRALEWLQYGDLSVAELTQSLPKLSKARVEIVMEALRAAGLVTLVRKHAPDTAGEDRVTEVYRFSAGRNAAEALDIGGGKPVALGSISKRIKASQAELTTLNERINVLKEAAKSDPGPEQVQEILRQFMKQDKSLEEDPFYSVAYKATCTATSKAAASARAAVVAQAKKKAAEDAVAAAALSAAAETKRKADEAAQSRREQQAAAVQARRTSEEDEQITPEAAEARTIATFNAASAASTAATVAAAAFSAAAFSAALPGSSATTSMSSSIVTAAPSSSLPAVEMRMSPATPAPSPPPAVATAVAESSAPFVGELGGLVVSGMISPRSIPPPPPGGQQ